MSDQPCRKAATDTQDNTNRINVDTDIHSLSGFRTHDTSVRVSEDSLCLRPCGHCDRLKPYIHYLNYVLQLVSSTFKLISRVISIKGIIVYFNRSKHILVKYYILYFHYRSYNTVK
jgi:hypothetical protein